ncbi:MAG: hypothetical protein M3480_08960 [Verrucomicrobiota bacterium]|nr:hypothetical protein [Chthoniobacterales bacterium]MDQ3415077.1 hypothetical protein [Verrucomicrobiota bacterium]
MKLSLFAFVAVLSLATARAETPTYSAADAAKHVGETATVTDKVEGTYQAKGGNIFLNMGGTHPNAPFTAFIPSTSAEKFPDFKKMEGATISVTEKITAHKEKAEIVVRDPEQVTVKEAAVDKGEGEKAEAGKTEAASPTPAAP